MLTQVAVVRAGKDGQPQSQVFSYQYDALGRRIAKTDSFGTTHFTWDGMRLLQESRGLLDRLFEGRVAPLVAHFSAQRKLSRKDIAELRKLLEDLDDDAR